MPTLVLPSKERVPSFKRLIESFLIEWIRWLGFKNQKKIKGYKKCSHKKGQYIFLILN